MKLHIRRAEAADVAAAIEFPCDSSLRGMTADELAMEFAEHRMRHEWTWLVLDDDHIVGRALWWGRENSDRPMALEYLDLSEAVPDRVAVGTDLIRRGTGEYTLSLEAGWRSDDCAVNAVSWRIEAAAAAGMAEHLERLRYEWTPEAEVPQPSPAVSFREGDDAEFMALFQLSAVGTLDITTVRGLAEVNAEEQATDDFDFYLGCSGERSWWRIALDASTFETVGFIIPSATPYNRNVAYLAVLPQFRGRGLVDHLLSEVTRIHAAEGAQRITATTDTTNTPMAAAFDRAGYRVTEMRIVLDAPKSPH